MIKLRYYKSDASTFVICSANGRIRAKGKGLSFFYNALNTSIAAIPVNAQQAPFIFNLQSKDYQVLRVQGQMSYQITDPERTAETFNFSLGSDGERYISEDPLKLGDQVVRSAQRVVQQRLQASPMREALSLSQNLEEDLKRVLDQDATLARAGIELLDIVISAISPAPETARALEAEAREAILKEADDAIYSRRKSSVEQERSIREAELQTEWSIQQKEQEIAESKLENERTLLRSRAQTEAERLQAKIEAEQCRGELVDLSTANERKQADTEAYAIAARIKAIDSLPVDKLKAMSLAKMQPDQLMAAAFGSLADNASKIRELTVTPELFGQTLKRAGQ